MSTFDLLTFDEKYFERIWGGRRLKALFDMDLPPDAPIGEAWLISDHAEHVSVVSAGPHAGRTLHELLTEAPAHLLGSQARVSRHKRFPLMLKLLDASTWLSIQVHPTDADAQRLDEPDAGKTEMWHVLQAEQDSQLICGIKHEIDRRAFLSAMHSKEIADALEFFPASEGDSVFVGAGTVHAIGPGIALAEIQQNSDLTYRIYDWDRLTAEGHPRELHLEKAAEVARLESQLGGPRRALPIDGAACPREVLAACRHFAAELIQPDGVFTRETGGRSFHILLCKSGTLTVRGESEQTDVAPGRAVLVPADVAAYSVSGTGAFLDYFVPDLEEDVFGPLLRSGHSRADIVALGTDSP